MTQIESILQGWQNLTGDKLPEDHRFGFRGESVMDSGYFYAPYIPLMNTPIVMDPDTFEPLASETKGRSFDY